MRIYFVRHGESTANDLGIYSGHLDVELTEKGTKQALNCKKILDDTNFKYVISSDLIRAKDTAKIICGDRDMEICEIKDLREMNFGVWEGLSNSQIVEKYKDEYDTWKSDYINLKAPEGESLQGFYDRAVGAYETIKKKFIVGKDEDNLPEKRYLCDESSEDILVVSHSGVIRSLISYEMGTGIDGYWKYAVDNCSVSIIEYDETGYGFLKCLNFTGKL